MSDRDAEHMLNELQEARAEIERLSKLVRWRKWPDEKPKCDDIYQVIFEKEGYSLIFDAEHVGFEFTTGGWDCSKDPIYWRPIGPLPGERGE